jgi:hypothetical protein
MQNSVSAHRNPQASDLMAQCFLALALISIVFPAFLFPLAPLAAFFVRLSGRFRPAARQLKRLDSLARSPLIAHVTATLAGLATVRAYGMGQAYERRHAALVDGCTRAFWGFYASNRFARQCANPLSSFYHFAYTLLMHGHQPRGLLAKTLVRHP